MSQNKGWISLDRSIFDHWIKPTKPFSKFEAWVNLIAMANHAEAKLVIKGQLIQLERGQQARSMVTLSKDWGWSRDKVKRFCDVLVSDDMITIETSHLTSVISVCNYSKKQTNTVADKASNEAANKQRTSSKQGTNNNVNNENNVNKDISSESATPPLTSFKCTKDDLFNVYREDIQEWQLAFPAVDIILDLNKMKVWLNANPKKIKTKSGMPKFITNWLGRTQDKGGNKHEVSQGNEVKPDNSAVGRVRANIERELREREQPCGKGQDNAILDDDVSNVRTQMDDLLRDGSGSGQDMGSVLEGVFSESD